MATLLELAKIKHHVIRSDGAKFLDGERNDALDTSWLTVNSSGRVTLGPGLYDELLVVKGEVSDDQIKAWASMGAPFYDSAGNIVYEGAGGQIEMDHKGLRFIRKADNEVTLQMDIETGSAYFSGSLSAEKIIEGIEVYGGLTADLIKAGTISYDRLNVKYAEVEHPGELAPYPYDVLHIAQSQDDWNIIKVNSIMGESRTWGEVTVIHSPLTLLGGLPICEISDDGLTWLSMGFRIPTLVAYLLPNYGLIRFGTSAMSQSYCSFYVESLFAHVDNPPEIPVLDLYIRFKRHAIA